jgi:hypothetical protein
MKRCAYVLASSIRSFAATKGCETWSALPQLRYFFANSRSWSPPSPRPRAAQQGDELAPLHVWMAPAWQEKM